MYHIFIHSSVDGHLRCFHVLVTVNSAAMNIGLHRSFWIIAMPEYMPRCGIAGVYYIAWVLGGVWLFATPWTAVCQAPLSMEFSRWEYWSGLPCPPLVDLANLGIGHVSHIEGGFFTVWVTREALGWMGEINQKMRFGNFSLLCSFHPLKSVKI